MPTPETESRPIAERLLPQTSIRFFVLLIGVCAVAMFVFRSAVVGDQLWATCASVTIATAIICFVAYMLLFLLANLFSTATHTIVDVPVGKPYASATGSHGSDHGLGEPSPIHQPQQAPRELSPESGVPVDRERETQ